MVKKRAALGWLLFFCFVLAACRGTAEEGSSAGSDPQGGSSSALGEGSSGTLSWDAILSSQGEWESSSEAGASSINEASSQGGNSSAGGPSTSIGPASSNAGSTSSAVQKPSSKPITSANPPASSKQQQEGGFSWDAGGNYTGAINIRQPAATGKVVYTGNGATVDASNASQGYVMVKRDFTQKTKVRITGPTGQQYVLRYIMTGVGTYDTFPLQMGNGTYKIEVMVNTRGNSYAKALECSVNAQMANTASCYLYPNLFVDYDAASSAVRKSFGLCMNAKSDLDKVKSIYNFIIRNVAYDYNKLNNVSTDYKPDPDETLRTGKGICFDYAALMATMLRAQGIPTKLVIGSAVGAPSHSWNEVYIQGKGWITLGIQSFGGWKRMDATFGVQASKESFIENKANYTPKEYY